MQGEMLLILDNNDEVKFLQRNTVKEPMPESHRACIITKKTEVTSTKHQIVFSEDLMQLMNQWVLVIFVGKAYPGIVQCIEETDIVVKYISKIGEKESRLSCSPPPLGRQDLVFSR